MELMLAPLFCMELVLASPCCLHGTMYDVDFDCTLFDGGKGAAFSSWLFFVLGCLCQLFHPCPHCFFNSRISTSLKSSRLDRNHVHCISTPYIIEHQHQTGNHNIGDSTNTCDPLLFDDIRIHKDRVYYTSTCLNVL